MCPSLYLPVLWVRWAGQGPDWGPGIHLSPGSRNRRQPHWQGVQLETKQAHPPIFPTFSLLSLYMEEATGQCCERPSQASTAPCRGKERALLGSLGDESPPTQPLPLLSPTQGFLTWTTVTSSPKVPQKQTCLSFRVSRGGLAFALLC